MDVRRPILRNPITLLIAAVCVCAAHAPSGLAQTTHALEDSAVAWRWPAAAVREAVSYVRLTPDDLRLRSDYVARDACRLDAVDDLMRNPPTAPAFLIACAESLFVEWSPPTPESGKTGLPVPLASIVAMTYGHEAAGEWPAAPTEIPLPDGIDMSPAWRAFLALALQACADTGWADSLLGDLTAEERDLVHRRLPELVLESEDDKNKSEEELDALQSVEDSLAVRFAEIAERVDWMWTVRRGTAILDALMASFPAEEPAASFGDSLIRIDTPVGLVILGSRGADRFTGNPVIVIDPGGDDYYQLEPCAPGRPRLICDWDGDDTYTAPRGFDLGSGFWSWGCLIDRRGDDSYRAGSFSLGAGWFGAGLLLDLAGRDIYAADTYTQGAGGFGVGALLDGGVETDQYTARLFAQGFGFAAGLGVLADAGGNDVYTAGGLYEDILRYRDHYLSLSQGFGYGIRPHFSGGVGLLLDRSGNDVYVADIFGQGCSYWWSFGGLYDGSGNDQYIAYQYAQGSATHLTAGCLFDGAGDDTYSAKGVSQGCGHDWAAGLLIDAAGNDRYTATDLSQAAGSANGVGILIDGAGDDAYSVVSHRNTQGYGNPRRQYGSVGLFLDLAGRDRYDGPGGDGRVWLGGSRWGVGVDADSVWLRKVEARAQNR